MTRLGIIAVCGAALLLGACSNTRRCEATLPYQSAQTLPPPDAVPGLTVPESPSALRIPPAPASEVPFGQPVGEVRDGRDARYECLDTPPRLAGSAELNKAEQDNKAGKKVPDAEEGEKKKRWWWPF